MISLGLKDPRMDQILIKGGCQRLSDLICQFAYKHAIPVFVQTAGSVVFVKKLWQNSKFLQSEEIDDGLIKDIIMSLRNKTNLHFNFKSVKDKLQLL